MDKEEIIQVLSRGYALEERQRRIDEELADIIFTDGLSFFHPIICADEKEQVQAIAKAILENREETLQSAEAFNESMSAEGDAWKDAVAKDLAELPKEKVRRRFKARYTRLLNDYEKIRPQLEELLKE